jgi:hypothetical protein
MYALLTVSWLCSHCGIIMFRSLTQSVGLLSYTFLTQMGYDRIVVPMVSSVLQHLFNYIYCKFTLTVIFNPYCIIKIYDQLDMLFWESLLGDH